MIAKNHEYLMNILKTVEHHLTTITGLIADDGNPEHPYATVSRTIGKIICGKRTDIQIQR